jgi:hypothetical protein
MKTYILILVALFWGALAAKAGLGTRTGSSWTDSPQIRSCVIAARVARVEPGDMGEDKPHLLTLRPLSTLAGKFDPSLRPEIVVRCYTGPTGSSIRRLPEPGRYVLAAIDLRDPNDPRDSDMIPSDFCTYMPDGSSLAEIRGLDDPLYVETLEKIQKVRAAAIAAASTQPTTRPAR